MRRETKPALAAKCVLFFLALQLSASSTAAAPPPSPPPPARINATLLDRTWTLLRAGDARVVPARDAALASARGAVATQGPWTVLNASLDRPSGDAHDYVSIGVYWWPCTQSGAICNATAPSCDAAGMPWVSCDGHANAAAIAEGDQPRIAALAATVQTLALGFYFSREEAFAARLAYLIEYFFLAEETRMRPNLNFGQRFPGDPGYTNGSFSGIIELDGNLIEILDALAIIALPAPCNGPPPAPACPPSASWTPALHTAFTQWLAAWSLWMEGPFGKQACSFYNNHNTWCHAQWTYVSFFLSDFDRAVDLLNDVKVGETAPIGAQIWRNGELHNEEQRVNSVGYVGMDLTGLLNLAQFSRYGPLVAARGAGAVGDLYSFVSPQNSSSIRGAIDYLVPFVTGEQPWPFPTETASFAALAPLFRQAAWAYANASFYAIAEGIANASATDSSILLWPPPPAPAAG
jgi:hypothetical protein